MTCDELAQHLELWQRGRLSDQVATRLEAHATECVACYARLDTASRFENLSRRIAPPDQLRATTLAAVDRRRRMRQARRVLIGLAAAAALVVGLTLLNPTRKSATDFPGAIKVLVAREHAQPSFAELDAAESELEDVLINHPNDTDLTDAIARLHARRDQLTQLVSEAAQ